MSESGSKSYPNLLQSFGLLFITMILMVGVSFIVFKFIEPVLTNTTIAFIYLVSMGPAVAIGIWFKSRKEKGFSFSWSTKSFMTSVGILAGGLLMAISLDPLAQWVDIPVYLYQVMEIMSDGSLLSFVAIVLLPSFLEEFLFRGIILDGLSKTMDVNYAILLSALFFGLFHGNLIQGIGGFTIGLYLGWIYIKTESILYPILLHGLNNGLGWIFLSLGYIDVNLYDLIEMPYYYSLIALSIASFFGIIFLLNNQFKEIGTAQETI